MDYYPFGGFGGVPPGLPTDRRLPPDPRLNAPVARQSDGIATAVNVANIERFLVQCNKILQRTISVGYITLFLREHVPPFGTIFNVSMWSRHAPPCSCSRPVRASVR